jgi:glycosyltransferase involved in cell wall biosynthesis
MLSICIPTYNRPESLDNCLNSIKIAKKEAANFKFEVCISDNSDNEYNINLIKKYKVYYNIKYIKNSKNLGFGKNAIQAISLATKKFSWMIGDDDLILPYAFVELQKIFNENPEVDFFFINSFFLEKKKDKFKNKIINTYRFDLKKLNSMSKFQQSRKLTFWKLIDPDISWDFLIGIFFSIFNTLKYKKSLNVINYRNLEDIRPWSNFDNTCLHPKIICNSFKNSPSFFCAKPLSVNLIGIREWTDLYEFVEIIRIPELLDYYRSQGLNFFSYIYCKNFSLRNFSNYFFKIVTGGEKKGKYYINYYEHVLKNLLFPNVYLSFFYYLSRKIKGTFK